MRWGVRDESTDDHQTATICLDEIRDCQSVSMGPSFVYFAGQKYGYRPVPNVIECGEFELITKTLREMNKAGRDCLSGRIN